MSATSVLTDPVLVLNRAWYPIQTTTVRRAVTLLYRDIAQVVDPASYGMLDFDSWRDAACYAQKTERRLRGCGWSMPAPEVIVVRHTGARRRKLAPTRRNLFARDRNACQYCGRRPRVSDLTLDHVIPRRRGGLATWENLVVACFDCNQKKGCRTPEEAGLRLRREPTKPRNLTLGIDSRRAPASWEAFLGELYWDQELEA
ncbi:MAG: HNH endonuclease [Planctomycetota bacterium]